MANPSRPLLLPEVGKKEIDVANNAIGPGEKRVWQSDEVEKEPDAKLCLKAEPTSLLFGVILRELVRSLLLSCRLCISATCFLICTPH